MIAVLAGSLTVWSGISNGGGVKSTEFSAPIYIELGSSPARELPVLSRNPFAVSQSSVPGAGVRGVGNPDPRSFDKFDRVAQLSKIGRAVAQVMGLDAFVTDEGK
jgi:hypothetical protein